MQASFGAALFSAQDALRTISWVPGWRFSAEAAESSTATCMSASCCIASDFRGFATHCHGQIGRPNSCQAGLSGNDSRSCSIVDHI
ncbi:uncharacterized protein LAESUDRAFT_729731 [Laetiporus sulphureus 93-53]|uniref:Uncharacterized protein n=1 Tax=Laetiporus sulphureus 93-53 TaxID=1314785 RepID=A0A165CGM2_9APHY|nr:uncharacterized protein LAESUDRAFT_729731 [Laetiporus sulphureus 93-53]KZT02771.1 hypothetical protein LAESUDRAFT_729731 [Laetiporus sulphureus 93-53]